MALAPASSEAELGAVLGGSRHTGALAQAAASPSDKEQLVVFSPLSSNVHVSLPCPFHFTVSSFPTFFSMAFDQGLDMLVEWQTQEVLGGAGGATGHWGPWLSPQRSLFTGACVIPGLALLSQSLAFSLHFLDGLSVKLVGSQQPTDHKVGERTAEWTPP